MFTRVQAAIAAIPVWLRGTATCAGVLMTTFADRFPESLQDIGLYCGLLLAAIGLCGLIWHFLSHWRFSGTAAPCPKATNDELPDWPIAELFSHIDPDVLSGDPNASRWETVGQQIRDALGLGRLKSWGRPLDIGSTRHNGSQGAMPPPDEIPKHYWKGADFTFTFFDRTRPFGEPDTTVRKPSRLPDYFDLRVNRTKAIELWPPVNTCAAIDGPISLVELSEEAKKRGWVFEHRTLNGSDFHLAIKDGAHRGLLKLEGKRGVPQFPENLLYMRLPEPIPPEHMKDHELHVPGLFYAPIENTSIRTRGEKGDYDDVLFRDIYASSRSNALTWLESHATRWRGVSAKANKREAAEAEALKNFMRQSGIFGTKRDEE